MHKKLTISIDEEVYKGLHSKIGDRKIGRFIENLVRPHVLHSNLEAEYKAMAADEIRERQATDWSEGLIGDADDATR